MIHTLTQVRVRYAETDRMNIVHHSNYLIWFELARIEMLDTIHLPYTEIESQGLFIPVLGVSIDYKKPAFFDDRVDIHLFMREKPRARFSFEYEVKRGDDLLATGKTTHGFMDANGKGLRPPEAFLERIISAWSSSEVHAS